MANSPQALKRARQAKKRRERNMSLRSRLRTYVKRVVNSAEAGDVEQASTALQQAIPFIDSAVNKGLIHKNKAARTKSRLNTRVRSLQA